MSSQADEESSIKSIIRKKCRLQTTNSNHEYAIAENHLNRDFSAQATGQKWVSDVDLPQGVHLVPLISKPERDGYS
jgi:transposase InsO family protein